MTPEAPAEVPRPPSVPRRDGVSVRAVLQEARALFRAHAKAIALPLAVVQLPLAAIGAFVPWILYATIYSDQQNLFEAQALIDGPRGLLFSFIVTLFVWTLFLFVGFGAATVAVQNLRRGKQLRLVECLDPPFTRLGGIFALALLLGAVFFFGLVLSITVVAPFIALFVLFRLGAVFHLLLIDELTPGQAVRRSWRLLHGNLIRLLGVIVGSLPIALGLVAAALLALAIISVPFALAGEGRTATLAANAAGTIASSLLMVPAMAYFATTLTVFFETLKARNDVRPSA